MLGQNKVTEKRYIEISWASLWRVFFFIIFFAIAYWGRHILLGLFLAIVISSGLETVIDFLEARGIPRTLGVVLIFLLALIVILILIYAVVPVLIADINTIFTNFDAKGTHWWSPILSFQKSQSFSSVINKVSSDFLSGNVSLFDAFSQALGNVGLALAIIVSSFYLSITRDGVERFIKFVFPEDYEKTALRIYARSRRQIAVWFQTQLFLSFIMAVLSATLLFLLGVKHAFFLAILAGIFELLPFLGPIISGAVAVLSALISSPSLAFYTMIGFIILQQFESHVLVPLLTRKAVNLHPVVVIIALLVGVEAGGFLGALIAVPTVAVFQEAIDEWSSTKSTRAEAA